MSPCTRHPNPLVNELLLQAANRTSRPSHRKPSATRRRTTITVSALAAGAAVATAGNSYLLENADTQSGGRDIRALAALDHFTAQGGGVSPAILAKSPARNRVDQDQAGESREEAAKLDKSARIREERRLAEQREAEAEREQAERERAERQAEQERAERMRKTEPAPAPASVADDGDEEVGRAWSHPTNGRVTSGFGARWGTTHYGLDIANKIGTPVRSVADGVVLQAGPASGFGLWIRVRHNDGTVTVYGHINRYLATAGQKVKAGEVIAEMGNRGQSTGPHLHFEVWKNGSQKINPAPWLRDRGITIPG